MRTIIMYYELFGNTVSQGVLFDQSYCLILISIHAYIVGIAIHKGRYCSTLELTRTSL